jgi:hypothetical protein
LIFIIVLLLSCNKNDFDLSTNIKVGKKDKNIIVHELNPPISIDYNNSDSIDINGDSIFDLIFDKLTIVTDIGYAVETKMTKKEGVQVVLSEINNYPDNLSYSENLNDQLIWSGDFEETLILQSYLYRQLSKIIGNYINKEIKYLGIKMDNRYGWVKLENDKSGSLIIYEYAIMK